MADKTTSESIWTVSLQEFWQRTNSALLDANVWFFRRHSGKSQTTPESLLATDLQEFWQRVNTKLLRETASAFRHWYLTQSIPDGFSIEGWQHQQLCRFITQEVNKTSDQVQNLHKQYGIYASRVQRAATHQEQWQHHSNFLVFLGYSRRHIKRDQAAMNRWFGSDAVKDRYQNQVAEQERKLCFLLQRLGKLINRYGAQYSNREAEILLKALNLQSQLGPLLRYAGDERVAFEAMSCMRVAFDHLGRGVLSVLDPAIAQHAYRIASDPYQPVWLQSEALAVLFTLGQGSAPSLLLHRFRQPAAPDDDFFFRSRALQTLVTYQDKVSPVELQSLLGLVLKDPSIFVRQQLATQISRLPGEQALRVFIDIIQHDAAPQVRGTAWLELETLMRDRQHQLPYLERYYCALEQESEPLMLRLLLELAPGLYSRLGDSRLDFYSRCHDLFSRLHTSHEETRVRRWAAQARERLWYRTREQFDGASRRTLRELALTESRKIKRPKLPEDELGRKLGVYSQSGCGFDVQLNRRSLRIRAGYKLGFRFWRLLHEWRNPATDKRQNHSHTTGRIFYGTMQAPPQCLAESSETKVPGEPLIIEEEQGWRPYLPLLDQVLSSLDQGWPTQPVKLYTSEGITEILPPRSLHRRLWAKFQIVRRFKYIAGLRNWQEQSDKPPSAYLRALAGLGFSFHIHGYEENQKTCPVDPRVERFFPALLPFFNIGDIWLEAQNYFYSVYQNTIQQLCVFLVAIAGLFFGQHFWLNWRFRKARQAIPYVIGGWGTRGKSGTERLKAALLSSSGVSLVSKSSGCEAQFLYAPSHGELKELFLFRPYDKASIWEQMHITRLAAKLKVDVFLWECMGLTPRYIDILQQQWMKDDLSTITNCYPDHEDIQGPSGIDIPKVMMRFVPRNAALITSEDSMSPLLESAARDHNSDYHQITWRNAYLLAPDVLARFPYEEHPTNIALVLKMAELLDIPSDVAIKAMADHVVPDLGVLKIYPESRVRGRRFVFINGMSANERFAALSNWQRLELGKVTPMQQPEFWLTTVVNNRADRIARSQVFARMLVNDLSADTHFLIGTNLDGLRNYIESAWQERMIDLPMDAGSPDERQLLESKFIQICEYIRIITDKQLAARRIQKMLEGLAVPDAGRMALDWQCPGTLEAALAEHDDEHREAIIAYRDRAIAEFAAYQQWRERITDPEQAIDPEQLREQLWQWYQQRFVTIEDTHASGNAVINTMIQCNFIYRWQTWDKTYKLCQQLNSRSTQQAEHAVKALASINDFGLLDEHMVRQSVAAVRDRKIAQTELFQAELSVIGTNLTRRLSQINQGADLNGKQTTIFDTLVGYVEAFLDPGKAVRRRKISEQIYRDLSEHRISTERAVFELQRLNKEQKGGWLRQKVNSALR
jgi:poly-gamma-glutamate synthase PgsB/CapB